MRQCFFFNSIFFFQTYPATVTLGDMLFVGLSLNAQDESLRLVVPECKATADVDRNSSPQYGLIDNK